MREPFSEALHLIEKHRPDLAEGFLGLRYLGMREIGQWLDEHLPVPGGWGNRYCRRIADDLRERLEPAE